VNELRDVSPDPTGRGGKRRLARGYGHESNPLNYTEYSVRTMRGGSYASHVWDPNGRTSEDVCR